MTYQEIKDAYNRGEQVPKAYLSKNGRLLGPHTWEGGNPYWTTPIRTDTPYYYTDHEMTEDETRERWVEIMPKTDGFAKLQAEVVAMRNKINNHLEYKPKDRL